MASSGFPQNMRGKCSTSEDNLIARNKDGLMCHDSWQPLPCQSYIKVPMIWVELVLELGVLWFTRAKLYVRFNLGSAYSSTKSFNNVQNVWLLSTTNMYYNLALASSYARFTPNRNFKLISNAEQIIAVQATYSQVKNKSNW